MENNLSQGLVISTIQNPHVDLIPEFFTQAQIKIDNLAFNKSRRPKRPSRPLTCDISLKN